MIAIEEMRELLSGMLDELPEAFFEGLTGGVSLLAGAKRDPALPDVWILGEYTVNPLGRAIFLYHGSFERVFGTLPPSALRRELRKTLRHEFRHHVESLAGEDALILEDARRMREYRRAAAERAGKKGE